jgi:hypothetical protein
MDKIVAKNKQRITEITDGMNALKRAQMLYRVHPESKYTWVIPGLSKENHEAHARQALTATINLFLSYK